MNVQLGNYASGDWHKCFALYLNWFITPFGVTISSLWSYLSIIFNVWFFSVSSPQPKAICPHLSKSRTTITPNPASRLASLRPLAVRTMCASCMRRRPRRRWTPSMRWIDWRAAAANDEDRTSFCALRCWAWVDVACDRTSMWRLRREW